MKASERDFVHDAVSTSHGLKLEPFELPPPASPVSAGATPADTASGGSQGALAPIGGTSELDLRGTHAPVALIRLRRALADLGPGAEIALRLELSDADLHAFEAVAGASIVAGTEAGTYRLRRR